MPKRKQRMAGYIRESDPSLATSTTIESQAKAVRLYGEKEHYIYELQYEYREAISAYMIPYMERPELLKMLKAAERKEFDVLVVSEVRAISRRQVEVLIIYDMLQKWGVRLETVKEKFADDAMGKAVLALRAMFVEIEREQSYLRMQRGKADRIAIGQAPNGHKPAYGYVLVDTKVEVKGRYEFNHEIVYTDQEARSWSRLDVCLFIFSLLKKGGSLHGTANLLNDMGIPAPRTGKNGRESHWTPATLYRIVTNPIYMGEAYANRYKQVEKRTSKTGKTISVLVERPKEEWIRLPDAPAMIDRETFEAIQKQLKYNKQESIRKNKHLDELGLLRAGYIFCGVCGRRMSVAYPSPNARKNETPRYHCEQQAGGDLGVVHNHRTQIRMPSIEVVAKAKIVEALLLPETVRAKVEELREANKPVFDTTHVEEMIENIRRAMQNLYNLAENATDDETIAALTQRMNHLEKQKRDAEAMLYDLEEDEEERAEVEKELVKFEKWAEEVRPFLTDPNYEPSYDELRLAIRILGLRVTVYPTVGDWPCRYQIDITVPEVMKKLHCVAIKPYIL